MCVMRANEEEGHTRGKSLRVEDYECDERHTLVLIMPPFPLEVPAGALTAVDNVANPDTLALETALSSASNVAATRYGTP